MHCSEVMQPISREAVPDRRQPDMRWSAVIAGTVLAIGVWIMLQSLAMGLGLAAVNTDDAGSLRGVGIGTGIVTLIIPLIALFVGAYIAGRLSGSRSRKVGAMHASVMWALASAIGLWASIVIISTMASGVVKIGGVAVNATSSVVARAVSGRGNVEDKMSALGVDTNDVLGPINERLQAEDKPAITAQQLDQTVRAVAQRGVREGQIDREMLVQELARNTELSQADAEDIANKVEARYQETAARVKKQAEHVALEAADKTGKALLFGGLMLLVSLGASIAGGVLGVRGTNRDYGGGPRPAKVVVVPPPDATATEIASAPDAPADTVVVRNP
jgi:hypothetical protein